MYIKYPFEVYYLSLETQQNHSASLRKKDTEHFNPQFFRQVEVDMIRTFKTEQRLRVTFVLPNIRMSYS